MKNFRLLKVILSVILLLSIMLTGLSSVYAIDTYAQIIEKSDEKIAYSLKYNTSITNNEIKQELLMFENDIIELIFHYYINEDEVITIGYNGVLTDINSIFRSVENELYSVIDLYHEDERLPDIRPLNIENLKLFTVNVMSKNILDEDDFKAPTSVIIGTESRKDKLEKVDNILNSSFNSQHEYKYGYYFDGYHYAIEHYRNNQLTRICKVYGQETTDNYIHPHDGDGNERFSEGYQWQPDIIQVGFDNNFSSGKNRVKVFYEYLSSSEHLENLQVSGQEGLEVSLVFYNYPEATATAEKGTSYVEQYEMDENVVWSSNQPTAYLDTGFAFDMMFSVNKDLVTYCIGVEDASQLENNKFYYWYINGVSGQNRGDNRYVNDGRFVVNCNRTYESESIFSIIGSWVDGAANQVTWKRFEEEHEGTVLPALNINKSWYNGYGSTPNYSAWYLASTHTEWEYRADIHTERLA